MSADNWAVCPICVKRSNNLKEAFIKKYYGKLDGFIYGKILEEIDNAVEHMESCSSDKYKPNDEILCSGNASCCLREDYEQGVDDEGNAYFHYCCSCCSCNCDFEKQIDYNENKNKIIAIKEDD